MNYVLLLDVTTGCLADNRTLVATESVRLAAKVYQPLGPADAKVQRSMTFFNLECHVLLANDTSNFAIEVA